MVDCALKTFKCELNSLPRPGSPDLGLEIMTHEASFHSQGQWMVVVHRMLLLISGTYILTVYSSPCGEIEENHTSWRRPSSRSAFVKQVQHAETQDDFFI